MHRARDAPRTIVVVGRWSFALTAEAVTVLELAISRPSGRSCELVNHLRAGYRNVLAELRLSNAPGSERDGTSFELIDRLTISFID
jgi:hypothetical protein